MISLAAVLLLLSASPSPLADARQSALSGDLRGARQALEAAPPELQGYRDALDLLLLRDEQVRRVYSVGGKGAVAKLLSELKGEPALQPYPELLAHAYRLERGLNEVEELRAGADKAFAAKRWDEAAQQLDELEAHAFYPGPGTDLARRIERQRARIAEQQSPEAQARALAESVGRAAWKVLVPVLGVCLVLVGTLLALLLFRRLHRRLLLDNTRHQIAVYDGRGPGSSSADQTLTARVQAELRALSLASTALRAPDQESALGELFPEVGSLFEDLQALGNLIDVEQRVSIGALQIPLRAIWTFFLRLARPVRYQWVGIVTQEEPRTRATLSRLDRRTRQVGETFSLVADGADAAVLSVTVRTVACAVALSLMKRKPTESPDAFRCYLDAMRLVGGLFEASDREVTLRAAKDALESAVRFDPSMSEAKLQLAIVLRKLGEPEQSRALLEDLRKAPGHAHLASELRYHEALLDAQELSPGKLQMARRKLQALVRELETSPQARTGREEELLLYTQACLLGVWAELLVNPVSRAMAKDVESQQREFKQGCERFANDLTRFDRPFRLAQAYALYARGRLFIFQGSTELGLADMQRALVYLPNLVQAHVQVARAHRKSAKPNWFARAERALLNSLRVNENDPQANEEYGKALLEKIPAAPERAVKHLERAADQRPEARYRLGVVTADHLDKPAEGIQLIREAEQMLDASIPAWSEKIVSIVCAQSPPVPDLFPEAESAVRRLAARGEKLAAAMEKTSPADAPDLARRLKEVRDARERAQQRLSALSARRAPAPSPNQLQPGRQTESL